MCNPSIASDLLHEKGADKRPLLKSIPSSCEPMSLRASPMELGVGGAEFAQGAHLAGADHADADLRPADLVGARHIAEAVKREPGAGRFQVVRPHVPVLH